MFLSLFIVIFTNVVNLMLLAFVLNRRERGSERLLYGVFAGSIIFLVLWSTTNFLADTSKSISEALFWTRASFPPALFMCWFVFSLSRIFPVRRKRMWVVYLYLACVSFLSIAAMGGGVIREVTIDPAIGISDVVVGNFYTATVALYLLLIFHATYTLAMNFLRCRGGERTQVRMVLIGWSVFLLFAVMTNAVLPLITGNAHWSKFGPLGSVFMVGFISYAILRYGFLHIKVIVQRGLVYSVLLTLITAVYVVLLFLTRHLLERPGETSVLVSAFITTVVGIYGFEPLKRYFGKVTAPFFFRDAYDYATVIGELSDVLNKYIAQDSIVKKTTEILEHSLKASSVVFDIERDTAGSTQGYVLQIPIRSGKKHIGTLLLGEKLSGDPYTDEDKRLLKTFVSQAATAFEKSALYMQVKEHAETLEKKVEERTSEIAHIQREQEGMMLEISHGLQTPLTIMKGELALLKKKGYEREKLDVIDGSIDRISTFIYKLLDLYRLETTIMSEPSPVPLHNVIRSVVASFKESVGQGTVSLVSDIKDEVVIRGDRDGLEEALSNLIGNAIKYSAKDRQNNITVSLAKKNSLILIEVCDTGIGIKKENIVHLFTKFFRVKDETTKGIHGTGLGLAVVERIIKKHSGTIGVKSVFGKGTTFTISLPYLKE